MTNKEKFLSLVSDEKTTTLAKNKERIRNREMLRESQRVALKVLERLRQMNWSQKDLALAMEVSPQQVSKIVSGKENLTIETQVKLQSILDIPILASYYEKKQTTEGNTYSIKRADTIHAEPSEYVSEGPVESRIMVFREKYSEDSYCIAN
ncbi:helix-turn-helix transcriptional regulator [Flectobacillus longus]|uniref:helix-turn-helix transcriptional regulator n=1 Tax=Flectobacillus longus TaxID=2984207 RepID=UPI0024B6BA4B|nr:helix-turn-helix transcriptional regulator [Flectobacillus longus]MDI9882743.1 helix-turn-helix transcriptional regulator [Flectobacillus longus]